MLAGVVVAVADLESLRPIVLLYLVGAEGLSL
jgi:hypothetical protein